MLMPEAPMHEDRLPQARKENVWCARQTASVDSEAVTKAMSDLPNQSLGLTLSFPDGRHSPADNVRYSFECH